MAETNFCLAVACFCSAAFFAVAFAVSAASWAASSLGLASATACNSLALFSASSSSKPFWPNIPASLARFINEVSFSPSIFLCILSLVSPISNPASFNALSSLLVAAFLLNSRSVKKLESLLSSLRIFSSFKASKKVEWLNFLKVSGLDVLIEDFTFSINSCFSSSSILCHSDSESTSSSVNSSFTSSAPVSSAPVSSVIFASSISFNSASVGPSSEPVVLILYASPTLSKAS